MNTKPCFARILLLIVAFQLSVGSGLGQFTWITNADGTLTITGYSGASATANIPSNINGRVVTALANRALNNSIITTVTIPGTITNIGQEGNISSSLASVIISNGVPSIGTEAFEFSTGLTNVSLPPSVTNIGDQAFGYCGFRSFTLGSGVTTLGESAFQGSSLTNLVVLGTLTNIGQDVFMYTPLRTVFFAGNAPSNSLTSFEAYDINSSTIDIYYLPVGKGWSNTLAGNPTFLWNPLFQTTANTFGIHSNLFGFNVTGTTNIPIVVEASTNLTAGWTMLYAGALSNASMHFSDPAWTNYPQRYYRIRSP
jgi:BspA type Leucine rich repeat region (6 copies)